MVSVEKDGSVYDGYANYYHTKMFSQAIEDVLSDWDFECEITNKQTQEDYTNLSLSEYSKLDSVTLYVTLQEVSPTANKVHSTLTVLKEMFGDVNISIRTGDKFITYNLDKGVPTVEQIESRLE